MARRKAALDREHTISQPLENGGTIKSARRVMQILELLDDIQRAASVMEIADALGYPQSSTSALLRSLVSLGYLEYDTTSRTYITAARVALLGSWVNPHLSGEGTIMRMMRELSERTGDTIVLATRNGMYAQYIHVIQATSPARLHLTLGTVRPLPYSGAGYAILSGLPTPEVTRIVTRYNAELADKTRTVGPRALLAILDEVRTKGYAMTQGIQTPGGGIIAAPIRQPKTRAGLVLGIGGITEVMKAREAELSSALLDVISRYSLH